MIELRLAPVALLAWVEVALIIARAPLWLVVAVGLISVAVAGLWGAGQVVLCAGGAGLCAGLAWLRARRAETLIHASDLYGQVVGTPHHGPFGPIIALKEHSTGTTVSVFMRGNSPAPPRGAGIHIHGVTVPHDRLGLAPVEFRAQHLEITTEPGGIHAFGQQVIDRFHDLIAGIVGEGNQPGAVLAAMVFGDTAGYTPELTDQFRDTGLAHLSAVSGANIAIVAGAAWWVASRLPKLYRVGAALLAIAAYALVVGPEPSVIRASIMGVVGLVSILAIRQSTALHALALAIVGVLLWNSDMAVSPGFLLSCLATVGIIAVQPALLGLLVPLRWPRVLARAVAVTLAAHLVTAPAIAAISGGFSVVAVLANVAAAVWVAPVTVLGLVGVVAMLCGLTPLAWLCIWLATKLTWVIVAISTLAVKLPGATITLPEGTAIAWAMLIGAWVVYFMAAGRWRILGAAMVVALLVPWAGLYPAPGI